MTQCLFSLGFIVITGLLVGGLITVFPHIKDDPDPFDIDWDDESRILCKKTT